MVPEKQFVECDPRLFGAAVAEHGVIILRSAIDRRKIARFKVKLEQAITYYSALTKSDIAKLDYQKWWPGNGVDFAYSMASRSRQ
jgi:hypothetical protein